MPVENYSAVARRSVAVDDVAPGRPLHFGHTQPGDDFALERPLL